MTAVIAVNNLNKNYGIVAALQGISFEVEMSELTVIIGPSGCGKSTLLRCLNGLDLFDNGCVRIGETTLEMNNGIPPDGFHSQ